MNDNDFMLARKAGTFPFKLLLDKSLRTQKKCKKVGVHVASGQIILDLISQEYKILTILLFALDSEKLGLCSQLIHLLTNF